MRPCLLAVCLALGAALAACGTKADAPPPTGGSSTSAGSTGASVDDGGGQGTTSTTVGTSGRGSTGSAGTGGTGSTSSSSIGDSTSGSSAGATGTIADAGADGGDAGDACPRLTCVNALARYCGTIGDGCGGALACGDCPGTQVCMAGVCVSGPGEVCGTCSVPGAQYCGTIGDGCGRVLQCGDCSGQAKCGGGGVTNVCGGDPSCTKLSCTPNATTRYCGVIGDGCSGAQDCGPCPNGATCGSAGKPSTCPI